MSGAAGWAVLIVLAFFGGCVLLAFQRDGVRLRDVARWIADGCTLQDLTHTPRYRARRDERCVERKSR